MTPGPGFTRSDARRNRAALLRAGEAALVDLGPQVTVEEIARRAGVTKGTFFRHLNSKEALVAALVLEHYERLLAIVREQARAEGSARERLEGYMVRAAESIAAHRSYINQVATDDEDVHATVRKLDSAVGHLLSRARVEGSIRPDIDAADVHRLILIATITSAPGYAARPDLWRRYLDVLMDGIGPEPATALPSGGVVIGRAGSPPMPSSASVR